MGEEMHKKHRGLAEEVCRRRMEAVEKVVSVFGSDGHYLDCRCIPLVVVIDIPVVVESGLGLLVDGTQLVVVVEGFVLPVVGVEGFVLPVDSRLVVAVEGFVLLEDNILVVEVDFV